MIVVPSRSPADSGQRSCVQVDQLSGQRVGSAHRPDAFEWLRALLLGHRPPIVTASIVVGPGTLLVWDQSPMDLGGPR